MSISTEELRERYAGLDTDELLNIKVSSDLTENAATLLDAELSARNVQESDYKVAKEINEYLESERNEIKNKIKRRLKRKLILWGAVLIWFIILFVFR
jgi:hypothetical protein